MRTTIGLAVLCLALLACAGSAGTPRHPLQRLEPRVLDHSVQGMVISVVSRQGDEVFGVHVLGQARGGKSPYVLVAARGELDTNPTLGGPVLTLHHAVRFSDSGTGSSEMVRHEHITLPLSGPDAE